MSQNKNKTKYSKLITYDKPNNSLPKIKEDFLLEKQNKKQHLYYSNVTAN